MEGGEGRENKRGREGRGEEEKGRAEMGKSEVREGSRGLLKGMTEKQGKEEK